MTNKPVKIDAPRLTAEIVNMTPALARNLRDTAHFDRQRPLDVSTVARYANEMKKGWFVEGTPIYIAVMPDGQMYILNGNHTLEAIVLADVSVPLAVVYNHVDTFEEATHIYANLDIQKVRSWRNALQALEGDNATAFDSKVLAALGIIMGGFNISSRSTSSRTERFALFEFYGTPAQLIANAIQGAPAQHRQYIQRAPVLAVAIITAKAQPSMAVEFWQGLVFDNGLVVGDPRKALLRFLSSNVVNAGGNARTLQSVAASLAWNAYYEHRQLEVIKPNQAKGVKILGTPWHDGLPTEKVTPADSKYRPLTLPKTEAMSVETGQDAQGKVKTYKIRKANK